MMLLWTERDVSLYALSIGLGDTSFQDKSKEGHSYLRYVYEKHRDFTVFPTMPFGTLFKSNADAIWKSDLVTSCVDFDPNLLVHGEQLIEWPAAKFALVDSSTQSPMALGYEFFETRQVDSVLAQTTPSGFPEYYPARLKGSMTHNIIAIVPKSTGVLICMQSVLQEIHMGRTLCVLTGTMFLRRGKLKVPYAAIHERYPTVNKPLVLKKLDTLQTEMTGVTAAAPVTRTICVAHNQALLYRLNGDLNVIHVDPVVAAQVGFAAKGPILHGLATLGMAVRELVAVHPLLRLASVRCRMTSPVYPGDVLTLIYRVIQQHESTPSCLTVLFDMKNAEGKLVLGKGVAVFLSSVKAHL